MTRPITRIIIQLVDVPNSDALIESHICKGMAEVGFHYMIEQEGINIIGRSISFIGNHTIDHNTDSIGIACIGIDLTKKQESAIDSLLVELELKVPDAKEVFILKDGELKKYK